MTDEKKVQKEVLLAISNNKLKEAVSLLNSNDNLCSSDDFCVKILICSCSLCTNNEKKKSVDSEKLLNVVQYCSKNICGLSEDQWNKYYRSVYHILRFLTENNKTINANVLEEIVVPNFWDDCVRLKHNSLYKSVCNTVHNVIADMSKKCSDNKNVTDRSAWCLLALKMYQKIVPLDELFDTKVSVYFKSFPASDRLKMYLSLTIMLGAESNSFPPMELFRLLLKTFKPLTDNLNGTEVLLLIKKCINGTVNCVNNNRTDKESLRLSTLLVSLTKIISLDNDVTTRISEFHQQFSRNDYHTDEISYIVVNVLKNIIDLVKSDGKATTLTEKFLKSFSSLVFAVSKDVADRDKDCDFCDSCLVCTDIYTAVKLLSKRSQLTKTFISKNVALSTKTLEATSKHLKYGCELIQRLKKQQCNMWRNCWLEMGTLVYNIGVNLYEKKSNLTASIFWQLFLEKTLVLEGAEVVISKDILSQALSGLTEICLDDKRYEEALTYTAINALKCPDSRRKGVFSQWVRIKTSAKDTSGENVQETTTVSALESRKDYVDLLKPSTPHSTEFLLINELEHYKLFWPSKKPMVSALKRLKLSSDAITCSKVVAKIWGDCNTPVHDDFYPIFRQIFEDLQKTLSADVEARICLAYMHVLQYEFSVTQLRNKQCDEMNNTVSAPKPPLQPHDLPPNPNDECDMVSAYSNLNVNTIQKIVQHLDQSLDVLKEVVAGLNPDDVSLIGEYKVSRVVVKIAEEYRLHNCSGSAIQAWVVNLRIAEVVDDAQLKLRCINSILEATDGMPSVSVSNKLLNDGNEIASKTDTNPELVMMFYIQRSRIYLKTNDATNAILDFQKADGLSNTIDPTIKIKFNLLRFQLMLLPCKYNVEGHDTTPVSGLHKQLPLITSYLKEKSHNLVGLQLYFELTRTLGATYKWLFLPREVRCYCEDAAVLAQKLLLPAVSAEFLVLLSHADLHSVRRDDCTVKLEGLSDILCLLNNRYDDAKAAPEIVNLSKEREVLIDVRPVLEFREQFLDAPAPAKCLVGANSGGSPDFVRKSFEMPGFVTHKSNCECSYCGNFEYHNLVLKMMHLYALLNYHKNYFNTAEHFFEGALLFHKKIKIRETVLKKKTNRFLGCELVSDTESFYCESFCSLLLDYGYFLMKTNNVSTARKVNAKLLDHELRNVFIQNEAIMQQCFIEMSAEENKENLDTGLLKANSNDDVIDLCKSPQKTPENKQTKVNVVRSKSPMLKTPPTRVVKAIKFDLAEQDDEKETKKIETEFNTILTTFSKTPLVPKIKVYMSPAKTTSKKRNLARVPDEIIPMSPDAYTPSSLKNADPKSQFGLRTRTKLLTNRLKSSVKENVENGVVCDKIDIIDDMKSSVRKKLMTELNEVTTDLNGLTISVPQKKKEDKGSIKEVNDKDKGPVVKKRRGRPPKKN